MDIIWEALRKAASHQSGSKAVISATVEYEMQEWLIDPWRWQDRARSIAEGLEQGSWLTRFRLPVSHSLYPVLVSYAQLLGRRRALAIQWSHGKTAVDTDPTDKCETMNAIRGACTEFRVSQQFCD